MPDKKEKPAAKKFEGLALEMDVMKKMVAQLDRLPSNASRDRAYDYIFRALNERKLAVIANGVTSGPDAGQLGLPDAMDAFR